jgi:methylamine dehydrogenase accessory protein MauD
MLLGVVILLMAAIAGLFIRMNQLQREVLAALAPLQAGAVRQDAGLEIGTTAPDFTLPDTTGQMVSLAAFAGEKVLLVFSSTRCPTCAEMYPNLQTFSESQDGAQVIMISLGSAEENQQLVTQQRFAFPVLIWDDEVAQNYRVPGTPFFYVINGERKITSADFAKTLYQLETLVKSSGR